MISMYVIPPCPDVELSDLGDRLFCLAHFYVADEHYRNYFLQARKRPNTWITLDNSAAERALVTEQVLLDIVGELKPNEVIAPDVLYTSVQTLENLDSFINKMDEKGYLEHTQIFGCPQGETKEDWVKVYEIMLNRPEVSTIGMSKIAIPHAFTPGTKGDQGIMEARHMAFDYLCENNLLGKPLHFLGMGDITEYQHYTKADDKYNKYVRSTDSCYTILAAVNGIDLSKTPEVRKDTYDEYYHTKMTDEMIELAKTNIEALKQIVKG